MLKLHTWQKTPKFSVVMMHIVDINRFLEDGFIKFYDMVTHYTNISLLQNAYFGVVKLSF